MLNAAQKKHFATFGYLVLRQVFAPTEIDAIRREADAILCRNRAGKAFTGQRRQAMIPFFENSPLLRTIMEDDRIYQLGVDLLGPDIILNASEGNLHVGDTAWHGGEAKIEPVAHIKIAFYLEKTTRNTGALRLIPGSNDPEYRRRPSAWPEPICPATWSKPNPAIWWSFPKQPGTLPSAAPLAALSTQ